MKRQRFFKWVFVGAMATLISLSQAQADELSDVLAGIDSATESTEQCLELASAALSGDMNAINNVLGDGTNGGDDSATGGDSTSGGDNAVNGDDGTSGGGLPLLRYGAAIDLGGDFIGDDGGGSHGGGIDGGIGEKPATSV